MQLQIEFNVHFLTIKPRICNIHDQCLTFQLTCLRFDKDKFKNVVHCWTDAVFDNYFDIALNLIMKDRQLSSLIPTLTNWETHKNAIPHWKVLMLWRRGSGGCFFFLLKSTVLLKLETLHFWPTSTKIWQNCFRLFIPIPGTVPLHFFNPC